MIRRSDTTVADALGTPEPGVYITVKRDTGVLATIYDDAGNLMANPFTSGLGGVFTYNISDTDQGTYTEEYRLSLAEGPRKTISVDLSIGGAASVRMVATRTALAALTNALPAFLTEAGREGTFVWSSSNLQAQVTADTRQGVYIPPTGGNGSTGAWVRRSSGQAASFELAWFGLNLNDAAGTGSDDSPAILGAISLLEAISVNGYINGTIYRGAPELRLPQGGILCNATIEPKTTIRLKGCGGLGWGNGHVRFPINTTGVRSQAHNTSGASTFDGVQHYAGDALVVEDVYFLGPFTTGATTTEGEFHGCHAKRPVHLERCTFDGFQGDGLYGHTTFGSGVGSTEGNTNVLRATNCVFTNCRSGLSAQNADSNAWTLIGCSFINNRRWGGEDRSFLGNHNYGHHFDGNARTAWNTGAAGHPVSYVSQGGNWYFVIEGQEAGAATNAPSGTTADNTWWGYWQAGGVSASTGIPAWFNGIVVRSGGPVLVNGVNNGTSVEGCHVETNGVSQFDQLAFVTGSEMGACFKVTVGALQRNRLTNLRPSSAGMQIDGKLNLAGDLNATASDHFFGPQTGAASDTTINFNSTNTATIFRNYNWPAGTSQGEIWLGYSGIGGNLYRVSTKHRFDIGIAEIVGIDSTGLNIASGKVLSNNGTTIINGSGVLQPVGVPAFAGGDVTSAGGSLALTLAAATVVAKIAGQAIAPATINSSGVYQKGGVQVVGARDTGWSVDTGTAKKTANATYAPGANLTYSAAYVQAEQTATSTRLQLIEAALRDATQTIKALKDALHGTAGHGLIGT